MIKRIVATAALAVWLPASAHAGGDMNMAQDAYKCGDFWTAFTEFNAAALQGDAHAQYMVGLMYWSGEGVPYDEAEAARWYLLAAENGDVQAQFQIGNFYYTGEAVEQDLVQAHFWFSVAARSSHYSATKLRDKLAADLQPTQLAEAQQLARVWSPKAE